MLFAFWRLLGGITKLTGLTIDDIFHSPPPRPAASEAGRGAGAPD